jgi:endonuclease III
VLRTGWRGLVNILDRAGYVRYDEKTATKLLTLCQALVDGYSGELHAVERAAADATDLERRLMALAPGIGPVTVAIFLRELRGIWSKADPLPCGMGIRAAHDLGFVPAQIHDPTRILERLKAVWSDAGGRTSDFADFETSLVRHGISLRRAQARTAVAQRPGKTAVA